MKKKKNINLQIKLDFKLVFLILLILAFGFTLIIFKPKDKRIKVVNPEIYVQSKDLKVYPIPQTADFYIHQPQTVSLFLDTQNVGFAISGFDITINTSPNLKLLTVSSPQAVNNPTQFIEVKKERLSFNSHKFQALKIPVIFAQEPEPPQPQLSPSPKAEPSEEPPVVPSSPGPSLPPFCYEPAEEPVIYSPGEEEPAAAPILKPFSSIRLVYVTTAKTNLPSKLKIDLQVVGSGVGNGSLTVSPNHQIVGPNPSPGTTQDYQYPVNITQANYTITDPCHP